MKNCLADCFRCIQCTNDDFNCSKCGKPFFLSTFNRTDIMYCAHCEHMRCK